MSTPPKSKTPAAPRQSPPLFSPAPAPRGRDLSVVWVFALIAVCALALGLQIHHFWPFLSEGAYASLRSSQRLLEGHVASVVAGSANLLWALLVAGLGALGMPLVTAAGVLGIAATAAGIAAVGFQVYRDYPAKVKFVSALVGCLALCLSAPVGAWAIGGLEQPLLGALLAWAAYFGIRWTATRRGSSRDADVVGLLLALAILTRADALLFAVLFYLGAVLADGGHASAMVARVRMLALPVLVFTAQAIFRLANHHAWLPDAVHNVRTSLQLLSAGLRYDLAGTGADIVFLLLAVTGAIALWVAGKKREVIFLAAICIGWFLYILLIGGDLLPGYRLLVPIMMLMGFLIAGCGLLTLAAPFRFSIPRVAIFLGLALLVLTSDLFAHTDHEDTAVIPAYLADDDAAGGVRHVQSHSQGDVQDGVQLVIAPHGSARFPGVPLAAGVWQATLSGTGTAQLRLDPAAAACATCIQATAQRTSTITVTNSGNQPAVLDSITLTRMR